MCLRATRLYRMWIHDGNMSTCVLHRINKWVCMFVHMYTTIKWGSFIFPVHVCVCDWMCLCVCMCGYNFILLSQPLVKEPFRAQVEFLLPDTSFPLTASLTFTIFSPSLSHYLCLFLCLLFSSVLSVSSCKVSAPHNLVPVNQQVIPVVIIRLHSFPTAGEQSWHVYCLLFDLNYTGWAC